MYQGRSCHQGRTRKTRQGILGHISIRIQPDQLRVDYALVLTSHQATPLRRRCLHSRHGLSGSYPLPPKCQIQHPGHHCSSHSSFHTSIRSRESSFLEPTRRRCQNRQRHHHSLICRKWHTRRKATTHRGRQDQCTETRVSSCYSPTERPQTWCTILLQPPDGRS